ncbi:MAG: hypothetical protein ACU0CA_09775 [Paracoccaceae bacterium]
MTRVTASGIRFEFDADTGKLDSFTVEDEGQQISPLHHAPWIGTDEIMPPDAAPHLATLGGDFFCAPFAMSEGNSPMHGWPANAPWSIVKNESGTLKASLGPRVFGASLIKELSVLDGHPFVYQRHLFVGGNGRVPVANHANVSLPHGGLIRTSPKSIWETPNEPQEGDPDRGRSGLCYPAQSTDPHRFPGITGPVDLTCYPWNPKHEDFVVGIEARGHSLGWTAVTRPQEEDLFLSLRNPKQLPMTMLWHSNRGRDYAPWSGRHFGCLGVEEGAADHMLGASTEADLTGPGAITLADDGIADVRHVIGAISWPTGQPVAEVKLEDDLLKIRGEGGAIRYLPFQTHFLMTP